MPVISLPLWVAALGVWFTSCVSAPPLLDVVFSSSFRLLKICSASLHIIFTVSFITWNCYLGVSMMGGELRIFYSAFFPISLRSESILDINPVIG